MATVGEKMTAIADAIRSKTGGSDFLTLDDIASGIDDVYEEGTRAMWDAVLANGTRTNVEYIFNRWVREYIRPPYVVRGTSRPMQAFAYNTSLKKIEKKYFDFSGYSSSSDTASTSGNYQVCYSCTSLEVFEDIGLPAGYYYQTWDRCLKLHTIEFVRSRKTTQYFRAFDQCTELVYIRFDGEIGQNISFVNSGKLTVESVVDILQHLADLTGVTAMTITLNDAVKTRMAQQGAMTELDGKTYDAYITDKGWNLA